MDTQAPKKFNHYRYQKHFCSSCQKEIEHYMSGLCEECQKRLEVIKDEREKKVTQINKQLVARNENNSVYDIIEAFKLLLSIRENNTPDSLSHELKLVSFCKNILSSESSIQIFLYFCKNGAATSQVLQVQLSMKGASVYRGIKILSNMGYIYPVRKINRRRLKHPGPRPEVWAIVGADDSDVAECIRLHNRCSSPKYRLAEEILPTILDDFIYKRNVTEVTRRELIQYVKETKLVKFNAHDIVELAIPIIESKGIKVWR